ncbi:MAG: type II toxin-antitoxin system MqsR family toxin [Bradymonadia bacterium]
MEKRSAHYSLDAIKKQMSEGGLSITRTATKTARDLGYYEAEILTLIETIKPRHCYKSMTVHGDHRKWQDVYHVPCIRVEGRMLYVKFGEDQIIEFSYRLISFKEK